MAKDYSPYGPPAVTVDVVIFTLEDDQLEVLLIKRSKAPFAGRWGLPGSFLIKGETTEAAVKRTLREKCGVSEVYTEQLFTFDDPKRDPRGHIMTVAYFALVPRSALLFSDVPTAEKPTFHDVKRLPPLAFDHAKIVRYGMTRLRNKVTYTNILYSLLPEKFPFTQLQKAYELILGRPLDKRNFRKKYLSLGVVEPTPERQEGTRHRPAQLFRFRHRQLTELDLPWYR